MAFIRVAVILGLVLCHIAYLDTVMVVGLVFCHILFACELIRREELADMTAILLRRGFEINRTTPMNTSALEHTVHIVLDEG